MIEVARPGGKVSEPAGLAFILLAALGATKLGVHLLTLLVTPYGIHRDEFLYWSMGRYLELWRSFFPPGIALLAQAAHGLFGDTLFAVRFFPAIAGTSLVLLAMMAARELGGSLRAQGLAGLTVLLGSLFLRPASLFQPVVFDQLWWTLGYFALLKIAMAPAPRWWLLLGLAGGLGLLTKFSIGFFGAGVLAGLMLSPQRRVLLGPWPYVAGLTALAIGSPSLVGQLRLGVPVLGHMRQLQHQQLDRLSAGDFLGGQVLMLGPALLLAVIGWFYLVRGRKGRIFAATGWACAVTFLLLLLLHGKPYYLGPTYPVLFAAGAVALNSVSVPSIRWVRAALAILIVGFGALSLPFGLPVVPPEPLARYAAWLGIQKAVTTNRGEVLPLPQDYADMLGWEELVAAVARAYHGLPPEMRAKAVVLASNYGEAGALDFFGPRQGLPRAVCLSGGYWYFGPGDKPGEVAVAIGFEPSDLQKFFRSIRVIDRFDHRWMVPEERDLPIILSESPYRTLQEAWPFIGER